MRELERLPLSYLRTPDLSRREFRAAIEAFEANTAIRTIDRYVNQWWETFWEIPPEYMRYARPAAEISAMRAMRLDQQVEILVRRNPEALRFDSVDEETLERTVQDDGSRLSTSRGSKKSFLASVKTQLIRYGWSEPPGGIETFPSLSDHVRMPAGWRISHDVYEEYRCNLGGSVTTNDIPDFSHIHVLPYVTHATPDRGWRTRCAQARDRLKRDGLFFPGYDRIYADLDRPWRTDRRPNSTQQLTRPGHSRQTEVCAARHSGRAGAQKAALRTLWNPSCGDMKL